MSDRRTEHERLETSLELHRREFHAAMDELKQSAQAWVAPRGVVARHPYPVVAAAFVAGLWLARR